MKKTIVTLNESELNKLAEFHSIVATYKSLLQNRYMLDEEKTEVEIKLQKCSQDLNSYVAELAKRYRIPKSIKENMLVSFSEKNLYIDI